MCDWPAIVRLQAGGAVVVGQTATTMSATGVQRRVVCLTDINPLRHQSSLTWSQVHLVPSGAPGSKVHVGRSP